MLSVAGLHTEYNTITLHYTNISIIGTQLHQLTKSNFHLASFEYQIGRKLSCETTLIVQSNFMSDCNLQSSDQWSVNTEAWCYHIRDLGYHIMGQVSGVTWSLTWHWHDDNTGASPQCQHHTLLPHLGKIQFLRFWKSLISWLYCYGLHWISIQHSSHVQVFIANTLVRCDQWPGTWHFGPGQIATDTNSLSGLGTANN